MAKNVATEMRDDNGFSIFCLNAGEYLQEIFDTRADEGLLETAMI